jgi:L-iditol 2-dehydrogenase
VRAAVLTRPGTIVLEDRPEPRPDPDEVLVRVRVVGVRGSGVHYFEHGRIGSYVLEQPLVLGHEAAGVVEAVSRNVPPGRVGERASIKPGRPDFTCPRCVADRNNLRERMSFHTTPPVDGSLAEVVVVHLALAPLCPTRSATSQPRCSNRSRSPSGRVGVGKVRCRSATTCSSPATAPWGSPYYRSPGHRGVTDVTVWDVNADRLTAAVELGATLTVDSSKGGYRRTRWAAAATRSA